MIKIDVFYPAGIGNTFDMEYYCNKHLTMVMQLSKLCRRAEAETGLSGMAPGSAPTYVAMGHLTYDSINDFNASFMPHIEAITADIPNYTNIEPVIQICEVKM
ncbi:MAG TPA: EthD family reductase [Mucilaginibacter sp.]|nr:EthD family reductase [Mucilaginibacter sp.]